MKYIAFKNLIILFLLAWTMCSCNKQWPEQKIIFSPDGRSSLTLINTKEDSVKIQVVNWYLLPWESQQFDTTLAPKSSLKFDLIIQNYNYYDLTIDSVKYKIFARPGSNDSVRIDNLKNISFSGNLKDINGFLLRKSKHFNSVDADWKTRINATAGSNFKDLIRTNDSITKVHTQFIEKSKINVPKWYRDFEVKRLKYLNAGWKLNSLLYRKLVLNLEDSIPEKLLETTLGTLPVSDEELIGNMRYMYFLSDYFVFKTDPQLLKEGISTSKEEGTEYININRCIEVVDTELSGLARDAYLTFFLTNIIRQSRYLYNENWTALVEDKKLQELITKSLSANPVLPKGSKLPYFYLPDMNNAFHQPSQFDGQILLINFWATWCKPCITEFPHENALVEQFKGEPVTILNICMESDSGKWKEIIKKFDLKTLNVLAQENWNEKLSKDFGINGLPHSILVDWNGMVVQNRCPGASENVGDLISELLIKMKTEDNNVKN